MYFRASDHEHSSSTMGHVYFNPGGASNHTLIVRCSKLNDFEDDVVGISR